MRRDIAVAKINKNDGRNRRLAGLALTLCLVAPCLIVWLWSRPIAAAPSELPPLLLEPSAVRAQIETDERDAAEEPTSEGAEARRLVFHEANVAERDASDYPGEARERRRRLLAATNQIVRDDGEEAIGAMRAADVGRAEAGLRGELPAGDAISETGDFIRMMERYGMARGGRQVAPRFVVRTALKARWNAMHGRELTDGFAEVESRAYWGWLALHAESAPLERRLEALEHYEAAGGARVHEARAVMFFDHGRSEESYRSFMAANEVQPSFRLRNHALAVAP